MMHDMIERLSRILPPEHILVEEPMSRHTTFRIGGPADVYVMPTLDTIGEVIQIAKECLVPVTVVGNGSNLLVSDKGIRGLVLSIGNAMAEIAIQGETMTIGAGALLSKAASEAANAGLSGMEFAAGYREVSVER